MRLVANSVRTRRPLHHAPRNASWASAAQWYFATFCDQGASAFEKSRFDELDAAADIASHLNGCAGATRARRVGPCASSDDTRVPMPLAPRAAHRPRVRCADASIEGPSPRANIRCVRHSFVKPYDGALSSAQTASSHSLATRLALHRLARPSTKPLNQSVRQLTRPLSLFAALLASRSDCADDGAARLEAALPAVCALRAPRRAAPPPPRGEAHDQAVTRRQSAARGVQHTPALARAASRNGARELAPCQPTA